MRLDTQSFFFFFFYVFEKQRKSLLHTLNCYGKASLLFSIVPFLGNICISIHLVCIFFFGPAFLEANSINWRNIIILHFYFLVLDFDFCWGPVYARDPIQPIDGKEQYEGLNRHDNRCYWESPGCVCPPVFLFLMFFFFLRYWRQLVDKKNGGLVLPSIMVLLMLTMAIDASILFCPHPLLIGHCMLLFPRRCCWYQYAYIYWKGRTSQFCKDSSNTSFFQLSSSPSCSSVPSILNTNI